MEALKGKKTYLAIGTLVAIGAKLFFDIEITELDIEKFIEGIFLTVGAVGAVYGRYDATK